MLYKDVKALLKKVGYEARDEETAAIRAMLRPSGAIRAGLFEGPAGCGKTALAEATAKATDSVYVYALLHSWSDDQELFTGVDIAAAVGGEADNVRQPGVLHVAALKSKVGPTVVCLDEVDKVQERTENLLLDFLQTGRVPVKPGVHIQAVVDNLAVFLTSNKTRQMSDPFLRRVRRVRMKTLSPDVVSRVIMQRTKVPKGVITCLIKLAYQVAKSERTLISLQEIEQLVIDVWHSAISRNEVTEYLRQWAARTPAGVKAAESANVDPVWHEVSKFRQQQESLESTARV